MQAVGGLGILILFVVAILISGIRVLNEYERGVVFRLGRVTPEIGPGLKWIIPGIDRLVKVSTRIITMDIPPQDVITRDNVTVKVNAVFYFRVMEPTKAILEVENYIYATSQLAQTTLRSVLGEVELDDLLSNREKINEKLQQIIDEQTDPWGVKVTAVEVKHIDLPSEMQRAMARQAEAERERRAKVIAAQGEFEASKRLSEAAAVIHAEPAALQLRFLQTLAEIATENNSTTLFPVPIDLFAPFIDSMKQKMKEENK
ncbi:MAG: slipin family protein [Deltaproteobacteria bacterium]|nr:slipin family protein [Deltaproteobacteria bacterium]MCB9487522.1 slipin family protein [Deltaproteobacteria bacterium]